jgi:DNA-binding CsgD family transcriptional regulator
VFLYQGEYGRARALAEEAVMVSREGNDTTWSTAPSLFVLAMVMSFQGERMRAHAVLEESLALSRQEGYKEGIAYSLHLSGLMALQQGDMISTRPQLEESLALFKELGDRRNIAQSLMALGALSFVQGDYAVARALLEESLGFSKDKWFIAMCLVAFAALAAAQEAWTWAARLSGAAESLLQTIHGVPPPFARAMQEFTSTAARAQLGEDVFTAAWAEGRTMTPEQALVAQGPVMTPVTALAGTSSVPPVPKAPTYPDGLTAREVEVLRLVAQGLTNEQVAEQLVISPRTVNTHLTSIFSKIGVSSRGAATRYAIEHHLA